MITMYSGSAVEIDVKVLLQLAIDFLFKCIIKD